MMRSTTAALLGATMLALAGCAGPDAREEAASAPLRSAQVPPGPEDREQARRQDCLAETGSHVPRRRNECIPLPGQVLTRDDLERTGSPFLSDALRRSTPGIR